MYLVCDGGGTKTEYMLFDLSGHIHGFSKTQGTNAIFINPDAAADAVCGGISDCLQQAGIRDTDLNIGDIIFDHSRVFYKEDHKSASCLYFPYIGDGFCKNMLLGSNGDHRYLLGDQCNGTMF